jgi:hypothetical protein
MVQWASATDPTDLAITGVVAIVELGILYRYDHFFNCDLT